MCVKDTIKTVIPCEIGERLWRIVYPHEQPPSILSVEVVNFRTTGLDHTLQVEVKPIVENESTWMFHEWVNYNSELLFKTKEAAEKGLLLTKLSYNDRMALQNNN